mmetsp:Transcript_32211/g.96902  ORF Transcript_32211/g.96902 Transcript_32211/m.96902 type:complete len:248 (+) Transcript_32211:13-756(+)
MPCELDIHPPLKIRGENSCRPQYLGHDAAGAAAPADAPLVHAVVLLEFAAEDRLRHPFVVGQLSAVGLYLGLLRLVVVSDVYVGDLVQVFVVLSNHIILLRAHHERDVHVALLGRDHVLQIVKGDVGGLAVRHDEKNQVRLRAVALGVPLARQQRPQPFAQRRPPTRRPAVEERLDVFGRVDVVPRRVVQELDVEAVGVVHDEQHVRELVQSGLQLGPPRRARLVVRYHGHGPAVVRDHHDVRARDR